MCAALRPDLEVASGGNGRPASPVPSVVISTHVPTMRSPDISVVVCTRDRPDSLVRTLESLSLQAHADFEVTVVDQSRDERTRRIVEGLGEHDPRFRYLRLQTPGLSRAYNRGISRSSAPLLAFTDDDCVAPAAWLGSILAAFAAHPTVLLLYGQVQPPTDLACDRARDGVIPCFDIAERRVVDAHRGFRLAGMGANFAARRQVFELVGPFDEVLGGGGPLESTQDFDFMFRVYRSGYSTLLEPTVKVYHYGFRSSADWPATMRSYGIGLGGFYTKHVRMRDVLAARLMVKTFAHAGGGVVTHAVARKPMGDRTAFAWGLVEGMRRSFGFGIDRERGVYVADPPSATAVAEHG
jgi:GT2 family glycosyltransferase